MWSGGVREAGWADSVLDHPFVRGTINPAEGLMAFPVLDSMSVESYADYDEPYFELA